ncbi:MAG TPA: NADPH-dependent F420 reductase [Haliangium sp.]|nr:NADPH-dependent F420 reductase [Haliangium sp.]
MRVGIVGGTGKEGRGLALRWARAGHEVRLGSRDAARADAVARELTQWPALGGGTGTDTGTIRGGDNEWAVREADAVVLSVPYSAHQDTLRALAPALAGKLLIDITVPLAPPRVREVHLPAGESAALQAQALLGPEVQVVAALHHVGAAHLADVEHAIECDVLVCGDDVEARTRAMVLLGDLGARVLDAGPLRNAIALESMTPVLLYLNQRYRTTGCGLRITGPGLPALPGSPGTGERP